MCTECGVVEGVNHLIRVIDTPPKYPRLTKDSSTLSVCRDLGKEKEKAISSTGRVYSESMKGTLC